MQNGPLVFRAPSDIPGVVGPVTLAINPNVNVFEARFEGLDYEATYILESSIFGHEDYGRLTLTLNGTWLSRAEFEGLPNTKRFGLAGLFIAQNAFPWNRANFTSYYDGPPDTWMQGLDAGAVVHWIGQYEDDNVTLTGSTKLQGSKEWSISRTRTQSGRLDYTRLDRIVHVQPAATRSGRGTWLCQGWR